MHPGGVNRGVRPPAEFTVYKAGGGVLCGDGVGPETIEIKPKSSNITLAFYGLGWLPYRRNAGGGLGADWRLRTRFSGPNDPAADPLRRCTGKMASCV